jgi:hypothetical protein
VLNLSRTARLFGCARCTGSAFGSTLHSRCVARDRRTGGP